MSGYGQTIYVNDSITPPISGPNLNKTEAGVNAALGYDSLQAIRDLGTPSDSVESFHARGHTSCGDGGGGWFFVHRGAPGEFVDDDGITIVFTGGDGSAAAVRDFIGTDIWLEWYGVDKTGTISASTAIAAAHDYIVNTFIGDDASGGTIRFGAGDIGVDRTQIMQPGVSLRGSHSASKIVVLTGTYTDGFLFMFNTADGDLPIVEFAVNDPGEVSGFEVDNTVNDVPNCRFAVWCGKYIFTRLVLTGLSQFLSRTSGDGTVEYSDSLELTRCVYRNPQDITTYWAVYIQGLGDGLKIEDLAFAFSNTFGEPTKALYVDWCRGGTINTTINGHHHFKRCEALEFQGAHIESGSVTVEDCNMRICDTVFWHWRDVSPKLIFDGSSSESQRYVTHLENVTFQCRFDQPAVVVGDIQFDGKTCVHLKGVGRIPTYDYDAGSVAGVYALGPDGLALAEFNNYSHILSQNGIVDGALVSGTSTPIPKFRGDLTITVNPGGAINAIAANEKFPWVGPAATYYYTMVVMIDPVRLIGHVTGSEKSLAVSSFGTQLNVTPGEGHQNMIVRYYRGTSSNSYDSYVDVPHVNLRALVDNYYQLGNFEWKSRTAGPVATVNEYHSAEINDWRCRVWGAIASGEYPTVGSWLNGDEFTLKPYQLDVADGMLTGAIRRTNGSSNTIGTDWQRVYVRSAAFT